MEVVNHRCGPRTASTCRRGRCQSNRCSKRARSAPSGQLTAPSDVLWPRVGTHPTVNVVSGMSAEWRSDSHVPAYTGKPQGRRAVGRRRASSHPCVHACAVRCNWRQRRYASAEGVTGRYGACRTPDLNRGLRPCALAWSRRFPFPGGLRHASRRLCEPHTDARVHHR